MGLGLCCQWLETDIDGKSKNLLVSRALQKKRLEKGLYTPDKIRTTYTANLKNLLRVLRDKVIPSGIRVMRISSAMFPLFDLLDDRELYDNEENLKLMAQIGKLALAEQVRVTTHPAQFVSLSAPEADTRAKSVREMDFHGWLFDKMGLPRTPYYSINVHGGKGGCGERLIRTICDDLSESSRSRMTLENCEFCYSVADLLLVNKQTQVPICYDSHHHRFNSGGLPSDKAMEAAIATWPKGSRPLTHLSNTKEGFEDAINTRDLRRHSDFIYQVPEHQLQANNQGRIDIDVEAKKKNIAIFRAEAQHGLSLVS